MPISIYPPTLKSTQPAFIYTESSYPINFTLLKITQYDQIGHVQIRVVRLSNNISIVNSALYPDRVIYKTPSEIHTEKNYYSVSILRSDLSEPWEPGCLYKILMRFGVNAMFDSVASFATWKKDLIDYSAFSEWSTVMIIKAISLPLIFIENAEAVSTDVVAIERTEPTLTPLFFGSFYLNENEKELIDKFKFDLYLGEKTLKDIELSEKEDLIESSEWLQHNTAANIADLHRFSVILTNNQEYTVIYSVLTVNGYFCLAEPYNFVATRTNLDELEGVYLKVDSKEEYCLENGCINIYLSSDTPLSGVYVLTRSCESTNFGVWENLHYFIFSVRAFDDTLIYRDFTIESGVKYRYAFLQENSEGLRSGPVYDANNSAHYVNFLYSYLYHDTIQLKLAFNHTISSFKKTVLTSKQDTLGGRYPRLSKNGYAYYAEFPISGLISFQMDKDLTFLKLDGEGFKYNDELAIPREKIAELDDDRRPCAKDVDTSLDTGQTTNYDSLMINGDLTDDNFFVERRFRERVEEFLNNFDYKLYKSPSEGNIVVALLNVSLTPNATLGRMIYSFSATAYEVLENTLENLDEYGIIDIGEFDTISTDDIIHSFGLIKGIYTTTTPVDVYGMIKEQEEVAVTGGYRLQLKRVSAFLIERYPDEESVLLRLDIQDDEEGIEGRVLNRKIGLADLVALNALLSAAKQDHESDQIISDIEALIKELEDLQTITSSGWRESPVLLNVNGLTILAAPNKLYTLTYPIESLLVVFADYPVIINYISELVLAENTSRGVITAIDTSRIWGQLYGVFTNTDLVIRYGYFWDYGPGEPPFKVLNSDVSSYNVYKTLDVYSAIEEETRKQVENIYKITGGFVQNQAGEWTSRTITYSFSGIVSIDIEARPNTTLKIGKKKDGSDAITVKVGKTGRYSLTPMDLMINYIQFVDPADAIVNYKCLTSLRRVRV